jgi:hypothetical protein
MGWNVHRSMIFAQPRADGFEGVSAQQQHNIAAIRGRLMRYSSPRP